MNLPDLLQLIGLALALALLVALLVRDRATRAVAATGEQRLAQLAEQFTRLDAALRAELAALRGEQGGRLSDLRQDLGERMAALAVDQDGGLRAFAERLDRLTALTGERLEQLRSSLGEDARRDREERVGGFAAFSAGIEQRLGTLTERNESRLSEVRDTLAVKLSELSTENSAKLDKMREMVEEKLAHTLEARLSESFRLVSERLEQVHSGLGEMRTLAAGVGDLKRVLGNVKTRGLFGEVQLAALIEQLMSPEQYATNIATVPGSSERVEFAIRLPGVADTPLWLPIDAKFPREDYDRLLDAIDRADLEAAQLAGAALERRVREEARRIRSKYISVPATTDFAILFLPTEGLYAEVVRRPGLIEALLSDQRIHVAGPSTLAAILSSLQMGFRSLAIERRSTEVWSLLGTVRGEFGKFGDVLAKTRKHLKTASNSLGKVEVRTRAMQRKLREVETLPGAATDAPPPAELSDDQ
jgi:DNA recombination protein RmuC